MFCAISGEPPQVGVVSKKSGLVYEKRLVLKYIEENQKDPVTGEELSEDDLVDIKSSPRTAAPRPPSLSSVPALLASLQNEWDATMLEAYTLKRQYDAVRQELAHALYSNDAANRVVARLMRERDQAREALANIQATLGHGASVPSTGPTEDVEMAEGGAAPGSLSASIDAKIDSTSQRLSSERKGKSKRKVPAGYATATDVSKFAQRQVIPSMHSTKPPGVTALDLSPDGNFALTGGNDKQVQVYDRLAGRVLATLKGHTKKINRVQFAHTGSIVLGTDAGAAARLPHYALSASADRTVRVWIQKEEGGQNAYVLAHTLSGYKGEVTGLSVHPSGDFVASASRDGTWGLHDLSTGRPLLSVDAPRSEDEPENESVGGYEYESLEFHPDGQLLATGTAGGVVRIWDVKSAKKVTSFSGHAGAVHALSFSENGYYLAAAARGAAEVKVWDLRKLACISTIGIPDGEGQVIHDVRFDPSAQLLAVVGTDVRIFANKTWDHLLTHDGNTADVTAARWDPRDGTLVTSSLDRTLRVLGVPSEDAPAQLA